MGTKFTAARTGASSDGSSKEHRQGKTLAACLWKNGAFNVCYRVKYEDGFHAIVRFAALGGCIFRKEKVDDEVAVLRYLRRHTQVPVPQVLGGDGEEFVVAKRPFTFNINELATSANLAPEDFPTDTFESATDYYEALATQHLSHFRYQRNDAVIDEADCQKKFVACCLFRKVAHKISETHRHGPFRLYCDDFRPSNILVDMERFCITAVIDWEFTYVAPAEFTYVAPWWLLLQSPEDWESDLDHFLTRYKPRLRLFLNVLQTCEDEKVSEETLVDSQRLAARMRESMESGLFWVCLAARYSSMFDDIYWRFIDELYFGPRGSVEDRLHLLSEEERRELDTIFRVKMEQARDGTLHEHYSTEV